MILNPRFGLAAAAFLLAGTALAHPHADDDGERKVERVMIVHDGKEGDPDKAGDPVRRIKIVRHGEDHAGGHGALVDCDGDEKIVEENQGEDGKKTRIVLCAKGGQPTAATAERIEKALERVRSDNALSDAQKARIETALRSALERARSAP